MGQKCINCGEPATLNAQKLWVKWKYDFKNDEYTQKHELLNITPSDSENLHLCEDCFYKWEKGEI